MHREALSCGRVLLSAHFLAELYDKLTRFSYWVAVIRKSGQPYPLAEMVLVTALLLFGAPLLLIGRNIRHACVALIIFQIPTTYFFETSDYERFDSISVIGGLVMCAGINWDALCETQPQPKRQDRNEDLSVWGSVDSNKAQAFPAKINLIRHDGTRAERPQQ